MQLDESDVRRLVQMDEVIAAVESALAAFSRRQVVQPVRTVVPVAEHQGFLGVMPAYAGALGVKLVSFYPQNVGMPTHLATILLFRPATGELLVTMDGRLITEMRTAAASAVATRQLARPDAAVLAILGSGVQAHSHLEALRLVRPFQEVRVWSPRHAQEFAEAHGVQAVASAEAAVRRADVVVVATAATTPVLHGEWLAPGMHINAVGATRPDWRELDDAVMQQARLFVDSRVAAEMESGDVQAAPQPAVEIGEVIIGAQPGRTADSDITLFKSVGIAVEDVATANLVYQKALAEAQTT